MHSPSHSRALFLSGTEGEGRGGTDVLIPQPYNECQWPTESLIVRQDLQAVGVGGGEEQGHPGSRARESQLPWKPRDGEGPSVFRKGKHWRANYGHFSPPPSWDHFSYKLFLASDGATTGKTNRRRVRPRCSGSCGDPRRATQGAHSPGSC